MWQILANLLFNITNLPSNYICVKAGEGNPQAREEEGKLSLLSNGAQLISGWNPQNVGIGIPWKSHHFHLPLPARAPSLVLRTLSVVAELVASFPCS